METRTKMVAEARIFLKLAVFSTLGLLFYYAHLFLGIFDNGVLFKIVAVAFLLSAIPLPIIAVNNKKLFPGLRFGGKAMVTFFSLALFFHHFLMTFIFVLFLQGNTML